MEKLGLYSPKVKEAYWKKYMGKFYAFELEGESVDISVEDGDRLAHCGTFKNGERRAFRWSPKTKSLVMESLKLKDPMFLEKCEGPVTIDNLRKLQKSLDLKWETVRMRAEMESREERRRLRDENEDGLRTLYEL